MALTSNMMKEIREGYDGGKACDILQVAISRLAQDFVDEHILMGNKAIDACDILIDEIRDQAGCD